MTKPLAETVANLLTLHLIAQWLEHDAVTVVLKITPLCLFGCLVFPVSPNMTKRLLSKSLFSAATVFPKPE